MKDIIRFKVKGNPILIFRGVTEEQAQEWCSNENTHKIGSWFDGYTHTNTQCIDQQPKYARYFNPEEL